MDDAVLQRLGRLERTACGPSLLLLDQQGQVRAGLTVLDDGWPSLGLLDAQGQSRLVLALDPYGSPMVRLLDERGQVVWSTP